MNSNANSSANANVELPERAGEPIEGRSQDLLFRKARSYKGWQDRPVSRETIDQLYALTRFGPTSGNCCPARFVFLSSSEGRDRLLPAMMDGNKPGIQNCGVAVIVAHDLEFFEHWEKLYPFGGPPDGYRADPTLAEMTAFRNGSLQGAYLIMAARSLGLNVNPMSGFDNAKVDEIFFAGTNLRSNFICCIGYGDPESIPGPRAPRLDFDEACQVL